MKQHLAGRGTEVVHCRKVPKEVKEYFPRDIERTKKVTANRTREKLRRENVAGEGNHPQAEDDEEAELQRALDLSRVEAEFR